MFQYFLRILRGQIRHWLKYHHSVVNELWQHTLLLEKSQESLFKKLILASTDIVEALVGMNHGKQFPFAVDCRTIDMNGYRQLYSIVMSSFVFQLALLNPLIQKKLFDSLRSVCGESEEQKRLFARLERVQALLPKQRPA